MTYCACWIDRDHVAFVPYTGFLLVTQDLSLSEKAKRKDLEKITRKLLEKNPEERVQSARELADALEKIETAGRATHRSWKRSVPAAVAVVLLLAIAGSYWRHASRVRWTREVAIPEITRLTDAEEYCHVLFDSYHSPLPRNEGIKEILDWLDKYLGPVS